MKKLVSIAIASGLLMSSAVSFATEESTTPAPEAAITPAPEAAITQPALVAINPANPAFMLSMINPASHQATHEAFQNPANWMQFMQPQFYMQMANPANAMAWMNPAVYQSMMNPALMMQWMQPDTIMNHFKSVPVATMMNPATFMNFMNPAIAQTWMNPATYTAGVSQMNPAASAQNMFDMSAWMNMVQPALPQAGEIKEEG